MKLTTQPLFSAEVNSSWKCPDAFSVQRALSCTPANLFRHCEFEKLKKRLQVFPIPVPGKFSDELTAIRFVALGARVSGSSSRGQRSWCSWEHENTTERVVTGQFVELLCTAKPPW